MAVCFFPQQAFQWKKGERLPTCCLNLRQTVSVWVTGLPTAIVTAHLGGVMERFSIFFLQCVAVVFPPFVSKQLNFVSIQSKFPQLHLSAMYVVWVSLLLWCVVWIIARQMMVKKVKVWKPERAFQLNSDVANLQLWRHQWCVQGLLFFWFFGFLGGVVGFWPNYFTNMARKRQGKTNLIFFEH